MRTIIKLFVLLLTLNAFTCAQQNSKELPKLSGTYLGQKLPGKAVEPFAVGITELHTTLHGILIFSPDGREAYWKPVWSPSSAIYMSKIENGIWTAPVIASFSIEDRGDDVPFISPDGNKIFFYSARPKRRSYERLWVTERTSQGWSEPKLLNTFELEELKGKHWQISTDKEYNLYFGVSIESHTKGFIYYSKFVNGEYCKPEKLGASINNPDYYNFSPFVSPDGSYLLFTREFPNENYQLFISFKKKDGSWSEGKNLSTYLGHENSLNPTITPDGKYLIFAGCWEKGKWSVPYWVDASFIEDLRKEMLKDDK